MFAFVRVAALLTGGIFAVSVITQNANQRAMRIALGLPP